MGTAKVIDAYGISIGIENCIFPDGIYLSKDTIIGMGESELFNLQDWCDDYFDFCMDALYVLDVASGNHGNKHDLYRSLTFMSRESLDNARHSGLLPGWICDVVTSILDDDRDNPYAPEDKPKDAVMDSGYIYVLRAENNTYKIGRAKNIKSRITTIQTSSPLKIDEVLSFFSDNYIEIESELHKRYGEKRIIGEWFSLSSEDISEIREYADGITNEKDLD